MSSERRMAVLSAIVEDYVQTSEPVGSRALLERHQLGVSAATVRNDMAALEDAGLIAAVAPRVCLIGVGADNDYGHPAPRTLGLLAGCAVLRTDRDGTILLFGSGDRLRVGRSS